MANVLGLSEEERWHQYQVCQQRGHDTAGMPGYRNAIEGALTWLYCRHCGTEVASEVKTIIHERGRPAPPEGVLTLDP